MDEVIELAAIPELRPRDSSKRVLKLYPPSAEGVAVTLVDESAPLAEYVALDVAVLFGRKYVGLTRSDGGPNGTPQWRDRT